jgi:hypothetical protein
MEAWQTLGGVGAGRSSAVVIVALVAVLVAAGCRPEKPSVEKPPVVVTAGDIAVCRTEGDEATAKLVEGIDGATVLTLATTPTQRARPRTSTSATSPPGESSRIAPSPSLATTSTTPKVPRPTSSTSVRPRAIHRRATTPTS